MSLLAEQYDRIERYLQGAMSPGELDEFAKDLAADPALASAINLHRELAETLAGEKVHQFRETLRIVDANWKSSSGGAIVRLLRNPRMLAVAASLLLLIGFFAWYGLQKSDLPALADANFEPMELRMQMGNYSDEETPRIRNLANQAYIDQDYARAAELFAELAGREPFNSTNQLYAGICRLGNRQPDEAITVLQPLADSDDKNVRSEAAWYLALAFMKTGNVDSARLYLTKVAEADGFNSRKAEGILRHL